MEIRVNQGQFGFVMGGADERARARVDEMEGKGFRWLGIDNVEYTGAKPEKFSPRSNKTIKIVMSKVESGLKTLGITIHSTRSPEGKITYDDAS